jgi:hypothetical protein
MLPFILVAWGAGEGEDSSGSARWGLTLDGNIAWRYSAPGFTSSMSPPPPKKHVSLIFGYLFQVNSDWLRAGRSGDRPPSRGEIFHTCLERPWGPPSLLYNGYRVLPRGKLRPGRAADHSPPSSAEVMEELSYTSTHPLDHTGLVTGLL